MYICIYIYIYISNCLRPTRHRALLSLCARVREATNKALKIKDRNSKLFVCLIACLCICLFACLFVCLFVCVFVCMFVCVFVCLLFLLFVCWFVCLRINKILTTLCGHNRGYWQK